MQTMLNTRNGRTSLLACALIVILQPGLTIAQSNSATSSTTSRKPSTEASGQNDFDFEIGTWKTHLSRRLHPLTGSANWVEYDGTTVVRKVWDGRANLVELEGRSEE